MSDAIYYADVSDLVSSLETAASNETGSIAEQVIRAMGDEVAYLASQYAPKDTGELAASIEAIHGAMSTQVVARAPYAAYVEFGTWSHNVLDPKPGTYEIRPVRAKSLKFTASDGRVVHTQVVQHPGVKPQPYLQPALDEVIGKYTNSMGNVGVMLLVNP